MAKWAIFKIRKNFPCRVLVRVYEDGIIPIKVAIKKPVSMNAAPKRPAAGKARPVAAKAQAPSRIGEIASLTQNVKSRIPTADTFRALKELKAGKLTRYVDEDDLFKKLGIKVGKT
jgi:hypothetical protein